MTINTIMRATGWSFSTLSGRSWRHLQTSVYELVYRNCGEVLAVVVGYLLLLKHVSFSALVCRSVGQNVDMLTSGTVSNWTATNIGGLAPVDSRIDPVGAALAVVIVLLGRLRQPEWLRRRKLWFEAATTAAVLGTLLFTFVVALFHLHFDNWTGVDNFFPHGLRGVRYFTTVSQGSRSTLTNKIPGISPDYDRHYSVSHLICNKYYYVIFTARRVCIARTMPWKDVRPSVCHTPVLSKQLYISSFFSPSGSPAILVFPRQTGWQYSDGDLLTCASNAIGV